MEGVMYCTNCGREVPNNCLLCLCNSQSFQSTPIHAETDAIGEPARRSPLGWLVFPWAEEPIDGRLTIGRSKEDSRLASNLTSFPSVSPRHAEVTLDEHGVLLCDLGSTDGTFVNDEALTAYEPRRLVGNDRIRFGHELVAQFRAVSTEHEQGPVGETTRADEGARRWLPSALAQHFRVIEQLPTHGGEADVYVVEPDGGGERVIAKVYRAGLRPKSEVVERLSRSLPEHVIELKKHGQSDGRYWELLEYAPGGSLRAFIAENGPRLPEAMVHEVLRELLGALEHLHERKVVHRDLKPDNILIRRLRPLDLVLTDFGIASVVETDVRLTRQANFTVLYTAPEALSQIATPAVDYWALGMMLLEMLNGQHPFAGLPEKAVWMMVFSDDPVPLGSVDRDWALLCHGLLTRNYERRWGSKEVLRWIDGDRDIPVFVDEPKRESAESFPFQGKSYRHKAALAEALASDWDAALADYVSGVLSTWLKDHLRDTEVSRCVARLENDKSLGPEGKLFRLISRMNPKLPPGYRGYALEESSLLQLAEQAMGGNEQAGVVLAKIYNERMLTGCREETGNEALEELEKAWRTALESFNAQRATLEAASLPPNTLESFTRGMVLGGVLILVRSPEVHERLRTQNVRAANDLRSAAPWFHALGPPAILDPVATLVLSATIPVARVMAKERRVAEERRAAEARRIAEETLAKRRTAWERAFVRVYFYYALPSLSILLLEALLRDGPGMVSVAGLIPGVNWVVLLEMSLLLRSGWSVANPQVSVLLVFLLLGGGGALVYWLLPAKLFGEPSGDGSLTLLESLPTNAPDSVKLILNGLVIVSALFGLGLISNYESIRRASEVQKSIPSSVVVVAPADRWSEKIEIPFGERCLFDAQGPILIRVNGVKVVESDKGDHSDLGNNISTFEVRSRNRGSRGQAAPVNVRFSGGCVKNITRTVSPNNVPRSRQQQVGPVEAYAIRTVAPVGKWSERVPVKTPWISCENFSSDVLIQGDDERRTIVDGPTSRNWAGIAEGNNLRTIRFRAKGDQAVDVVCHVYSVPPTRD